MMSSGQLPIPKQFADMSMQMLAPKRSVIVDMVMVQLISAIVVFVGILLFKANVVRYAHQLPVNMEAPNESVGDNRR
jgi:hypothetical protein